MHFRRLPGRCRVAVPLSDGAGPTRSPHVSMHVAAGQSTPCLLMVSLHIGAIVARATSKLRRCEAPGLQEQGLQDGGVQDPGRAAVQAHGWQVRGGSCCKAMKRPRDREIIRTVPALFWGPLVIVIADRIIPTELKTLFYLFYLLQPRFFLLSDLPSRFQAFDTATFASPSCEAAQWACSKLDQLPR